MNMSCQGTKKLNVKLYNPITNDQIYWSDEAKVIKAAVTLNRINIGVEVRDMVS